MAKLQGILPLRGTIQNMTFAHTKNGIVVREKSGVSKQRIETDPAFVRTRENNTEFRTAGKSAKLVNDAFRSSLPSAKDSAVYTRLMKTMKQALNFDVTNVRGLRNVVDGQLSVVDGFEFNETTRLGSVLFVPFTSAIDRTAGELEVTLPAYIPADVVVPPVGATHFRIVATGAELNFTDYQETHDKQQTAYLPLNGTATTAATLTCALAANSTHPLMLAVGIEFFMDSGGQKYPLKDGSAHAVVSIDM